MGAGQTVEQLLVELVAEAGDLADELRERRVRIVMRRPRARDAGAHQDRAGEHGRGFDQSLRIDRSRLPAGGPVHECIECPLPDDEAAIEAAAVDAVGIPFAEEHVGPLRDRVEVIGRSRVDRQRVEPLGVETRLLEQFRFGAVEQVERRPHHLGIRPRRGADAAEVERDRADFLVRIEFGLGPRFEQRDRAISDEVIQVEQRIRYDAERCGAGREFGKDRFAAARQKKGREERRVGLVGQQVGMMLAVGHEQLVEGDADDVLRAGQIGEGRGAGALQIRRRGEQPFAHCDPGGRIAIGEPVAERIGQEFAEARVGPAVGEVEVSQRFRGIEQARQVREECVHPSIPPQLDWSPSPSA